MGRREDKREETLARIEETALRLFERDGFEATPVTAIAAAAGVSRSTLFRHFASKDDLLFANHSRDLDLLRSLTRDITRASPSDSDRTVLAAVLVRFAEHLAADAESLAVRARIVAADPRLMGRAMTTRSDWERVLAVDLAAARGADEPDLALRVDAAAAVAALHMAVRTWRLGGGAEPLVPLVRTALAHLESAT
jgi:AcrR family transcriptional regulator